MNPTGALAVTTGGESIELTLRPYDGDVFVARAAGEDDWTPAVFFSLPDGRRYLHFGARATPRRED